MSTLRRLTVYFIFMTCLMLTLVGLPRLAEALWGGKSLSTALGFLIFPVMLWVAYFFGARPDIQREERLKQEQQATTTEVPILENPVPERKWFHYVAPYSTWLMGFSALEVGWERFTGLAAPLWFRMLFLVCAVGCGVLGFFLGWEDVWKHWKEQRALRNLKQQRTTTEDTTQTHILTIENPEGYCL